MLMDNLARQRCYWTGMGAEIEKYCQNCQHCVLSKTVQPQVKTYQGALLASQPLEILAIDFTLLKPATDQRENVLVMTYVFFLNTHRPCQPRNKVLLQW